MSDQHDLRPWYSWLPLPGLILGMPFAFIAFCGNQWQAEHSTFATLAKHKRKPQLHTWLDGKRTRLAATSWLSWPPLEFAHCDLQPTPQPRYAICFDAIQDKATLVRADIEPVSYTHLAAKSPTQTYPPPPRSYSSQTKCQSEPTHRGCRHAAWPHTAIVEAASHPSAWLEPVSYTHLGSARTDHRSSRCCAPEAPTIRDACSQADREGPQIRFVHCRQC